MAHTTPSRCVACALALLIALLPLQPVRAQPRAAPAAQAAVPVLVELDAPPLIETWLAAGGAGASAAATQAQLAAISAQQAALAAALPALGAVTLYRAQRVYNGVAVLAPPASLAALAALPGVRALRPLIAKWPDNSVSVPFLGAPALWQGSAGVSLTGAGIRIGIIDTGIDYIHRDFGGPGSGYTRNNPTLITDLPYFPGVKVVGGFDFAGETYNANPDDLTYQPTPQPDPDPFDCYGHGTHVAGTAAGFGVTASGLTFPGPYTATVPFAALAIGPGMAPHASLYALKVFGCTGSSLLVDQALEWAVDPNGDGDFSDHLDIVNLSLGSPFGGVDDTTSIAADRAARLGVIVVASAGNSGQVNFAVGSPGVADWAISVAASAADDGAPIAGGAASDVIQSFSARGPRTGGALKPDLAAPGAGIVSAQAGSGTGSTTLSGTSMAAPHVAGALALLRQLHPTWRVEELKALLVNTAAPVVRGATPFTATVAPPLRTGAGRLALDAAVRSQVIAFGADTPGLVNLSFGTPAVLGAFSAVRNVRVANMGAAAQTYAVRYTSSANLPGVEIGGLPPTLTVGAHGVTGFAVTLGANSALLRNVRAVPEDLSYSALRAWQSEEQGTVWLWPLPARFSAGLPVATNSVITAAATLDVDTRLLTVTLPTFPAALASLTIHRGPPGQIATSSAYTLFDAAISPAPIFPLTRVVTLAAADLPLLAGGYLALRAQGSAAGGPFATAVLRADVPVLHLPLSAAPRPVTAMHAAEAALDFGVGPALKPLPLAGVTLAYTDTPTSTRPLLALLELHARSPQAPASQQPPTPGNVDIQYVGVGSDFTAVADKTAARVFFGIATYGAWSTPNQVLFSIYVDVDNDLTPDYRVYNTTAPALSGLGQASDAFVAAVQVLGSGARRQGDPLNVLAPSQFQTAILDSNVMLLSVPAAALGLSAAHPAFSFRLDSTATTAEGAVTGDAVAAMRYNIAQPGLLLANGQAGSPLFTDAPDTALNVGFNLSAYVRSTARGVLLLHLHNEAGQRAEAVPVRFRWPTQIIFPIMRR